MIKYSYIDRDIQKGFLTGVAGCIEHSFALFEALREAKENTRQIVVTRPVDGALDCVDVMRRVNERTPVSPFDVDSNASTTTARALRASYAMADVKASRKKVQPILVDVFTALSAETQS